MSSISLLLLAVHDTVHDSRMKLNYSEPKIYTGGVDPKQWSKLSKKQQKEALKKSWYVYFSFKNPETGKLKRQSNIKAGANTLTNKRDRLAFLKVLQRNLLLLLQAGFDPYTYDAVLTEKFISKKASAKNAITPKSVEYLKYFGVNNEMVDKATISYNPLATMPTETVQSKEAKPTVLHNPVASTTTKTVQTKTTKPTVLHNPVASTSTKTVQSKTTKPTVLHNPVASTTTKTVQSKATKPTVLNNKVASTTTKTVETKGTEIELYQQNETTVQEAFELGLKIKSNTLNENSYPKFRSRILRFQKWLIANGITHINMVNKKIVVLYLNSVLERTSSRNRNNARASLSSLFTTLENNEIIHDNFILKINVLKAIPKRHKTYTPKQVEQMSSYMEANDPIMKLFTEFISYNFLRPIEVCRLKINDIDISDRKIYVKAKNKPVKIKIIPEILLTKLPDLKTMNGDHYIFTPTKIGGAWDVGETDKRNYFSKRFRKIKNHFKLGKDYGLYSYRHTFITRLYREMAKTASPMEVKSKLMTITGHTTIVALEKYLRDIDAVLPDDYSHLF